MFFQNLQKKFLRLFHLTKEKIFYGGRRAE